MKSKTTPVSDFHKNKVLVSFIKERLILHWNERGRELNQRKKEKRDKEKDNGEKGKKPKNRSIVFYNVGRYGVIRPPLSPRGGYVYERRK